MGANWRIEAVHRETGERRAFEGPDVQALQAHAVELGYRITNTRPMDAEPEDVGEPDDGVPPYLKIPLTGRYIAGDAEPTAGNIALAVQHGMFWAGVKLLLVLGFVQLLAGIFLVMVLSAQK